MLTEELWYRSDRILIRENGDLVIVEKRNDMPIIEEDDDLRRRIVWDCIDVEYDDMGEYVDTFDSYVDVVKVAEEILCGEKNENDLEN